MIVPIEFIDAAPDLLAGLGSTSQVDSVPRRNYRAVENEIMRRLDIRGELSAHVRFTGSEPSNSGWLECHAIGRDDSSPSAAVNASGEAGKLGRYKDQGSGESLNFWELTVRLGMFRDWRESRTHYAAKTGVSLTEAANTTESPAAATKPVATPTETPKKARSPLDEQIADSVSPELHDVIIERFCQNIKGVTPQAVDAAGGIVCTWPAKSKRNLCIALPAYRNNEHTGTWIRRADGNKLPAVGKLKERKSHTVAGSRDGWIILGGQRALDAAHTVIKCEGPPDALTAYAHIPAGYCVITNICGASVGSDMPPNPYAGKRLIVVGDCDDAGKAGAEKFARAAAAHASEVRIAALPFTHTAAHGKDLRDFFNEGGCFEHLLHLAAVEGQRIDRPTIELPAADSVAGLTWQPCEGDTVRTKDRGNFGQVVSVASGVASVRFINPHDGATAVVEYAVDQIEPTSSRGSQSRRPILRHTVKSMRDAYPELDEPVIDGWLRVKEIANVISSPKIGKSWLAYYFILSVVSGRAIFDCFSTMRGRVLLVDNELTPSLLPRRIATVAQAMGMQPHEYEESIDIWSLRHSPRSIFDLAAEFKDTPAGTYVLVVLDAKYKAIGPDADENSNADEARFFAEAGILAEQTGSAWILIHHATKGSQADKRVTDVGSGASSQARAADSHIVLREHQEADAVVMGAAVRSFPPVTPIGLRWQFPLWVRDESIDTGLLKGRNPDQGEKQNEADVKILDLCQTWQSRNQIRESTGMGASRVNSAIARLIKLKYLEAGEEARPKNPKCEVFRKTIHAKD